MLFCTLFLSALYDYGVLTFMEDVKVQKVMLHVEGTTICNDDFQWDTALQHCCNHVLNSCNIDPTLQRCTSVAQSSLRIVSWNITLKKKDDEIFFLFCPEY